MCDLGLPCGDPYCPFVSDYIQQGTKIHQEMEIKGVETGHIEPDEGRTQENMDRPFDAKDPWEFKYEVSPTHMNF